MRFVVLGKHELSPISILQAVVQFTPQMQLLFEPHRQVASPELIHIPNPEVLFKPLEEGQVAVADAPERFRAVI